MTAESTPRRRTTVALALTALATSGLVAGAAPAGASTAPTTTLTNGILTVSGTAARDLIGITVDANRLTVDFGLDGTVDAQFARSQVRQVHVSAGDGDDGVNLAGAGDVPVTINGGRGDDGIGVVGNIGQNGATDAPTTINGSSGNDDVFAAAPGPLTVNAGSGNDRVEGGGAGVGREAIALGGGNDRFVSSLNAFVGPRSDFVDGGAGHNTMVMNGTFASETLDLSADAGHLIVTHDLRDRIDADNVQTVAWFGFGGSDDGDSLTVNDLSGTDVTRFTPNFSAPGNPTSANNSADTLTVRANPADDNITVSGSAATITVAGLAASVTPVLMDRQDTLRIGTADGKASVDTSGLPAGLVQLQVI